MLAQATWFRLGLVLGLGMLAGWHVPAAAEGLEPLPPPTYGVLNGGRGIPANGALLLSGPPGDIINVSVTQVGAESPVPEGLLAPLTNVTQWAWMPAEPFIAGESYEVAISAGDGDDQTSLTTFDAVEAIDIVQPELTSEPSLSIVTMPGATACCQSRVGQGLIENQACFQTQVERYVQLDPGLSTAEPALLINQFVFRISWGPPVLANVMSARLPDVALPPSRDQADEYCFVLEAVQLATGARYPYDDLDRCVPHGDLEDLGVHDLELGATELDRSGCRGAPMGFEDEWCEVNADCATDDDAMFCELYDHFCLGEPLPRDPDVPDLSRDAGSTPDAGEEPDAGDEPSVESGRSSGCSVAGQSQGSAAAWLGMLISLVVLASRRGPRCATALRHSSALARALARFSR